AEVKRECDRIRRIEPANTPFPKRAKRYLRFFTPRTRARPLQVNAEAGDYKEQKDADVRLGDDEVDHPYRVLQQVRRHCCSIGRVIKDDRETSNAAQRVEA